MNAGDFPVLGLFMIWQMLKYALWNKMLIFIVTPAKNTQQIFFVMRMLVKISCCAQPDAKAETYSINL